MADTCIKRSIAGRLSSRIAFDIDFIRLRLAGAALAEGGTGHILQSSIVRRTFVRLPHPAKAQQTNFLLHSFLHISSGVD